MASKKPQTHEAMDAETFDLDAWIDDVERPSVTVELYPREVWYLARVAEIEAQIKAAEKVKPEDRGVEDASPEALLAQLEELRAQRSAEAIKVEMRQVLDAELAQVRDEWKRRDPEKDPASLDIWVVAAATVQPKFTPAQVERLRKRDRSGEQMVAQMVAAAVELQRGLPVPS